MSQWQIEAVSATGAVMMFGLAAGDGDAAEARAMELLPFDPRWLTVSEVPSRR